MKNELATKKFSLVKTLSLAGLALSAAVVLSNCGKTETAASSATFSTLWSSTFSSKCSGCHTSVGTPNNSALDFSSKSALYNSLQGTQQGASTPACSGVKLVQSGQPANSYLAGTLIASYNVNNFAGVSSCTPFATHLQQLNLSSEEQNNIVSWITAGAQNN